LDLERVTDDQGQKILGLSRKRKAHRVERCGGRKGQWPSMGGRDKSEKEMAAQRRSIKRNTHPKIKARGTAILGEGDKRVQHVA